MLFREHFSPIWVYAAPSSYVHVSLKVSALVIFLRQIRRTIWIYCLVFEKYSILCLDVLNPCFQCSPDRHPALPALELQVISLKFLSSSGFNMHWEQAEPQCEVLKQATHSSVVSNPLCRDSNKKKNLLPSLKYHDKCALYEQRLYWAHSGLGPLKSITCLYFCFLWLKSVPQISCWWCAFQYKEGDFFYFHFLLRESWPSSSHLSLQIPYHWNNHLLLVIILFWHGALSSCIILIQLSFPLLKFIIVFINSLRIPYSVFWSHSLQLSCLFPFILTPTSLPPKVF